VSSQNAIKTAQRYRDLRAAGKCVNCTMPSGDRSRCPDCLAALRDEYQERVRLGLCVRRACKKDAVPGFVQCADHKQKNNDLMRKARQNQQERAA
jgi:hypothetical protein